MRLVTLTLLAAFALSCGAQQHPHTAAEDARIAVSLSTHGLAVFDNTADAVFKDMAAHDRSHALAVFTPIRVSEEASLAALHDIENVLNEAERLNIVPDKCRLATLARIAVHALDSLVADAHLIPGLSVPADVASAVSQLVAVADVMTECS